VGGGASLRGSRTALVPCPPQCSASVVVGRPPVPHLRWLGAMYSGSTLPACPQQCPASSPCACLQVPVLLAVCCVPTEAMACLLPAASVCVGVCICLCFRRCAGNSRSAHAPCMPSPVPCQQPQCVCAPACAAGSVLRADGRSAGR